MIKLYPFVTYNDENDKEYIYGSKDKRRGKRKGKMLNSKKEKNI